MFFLSGNIFEPQVVYTDVTVVLLFGIQAVSTCLWHIARTHMTRQLAFFTRVKVSALEYSQAISSVSPEYVCMFLLHFGELLWLCILSKVIAPQHNIFLRFANETSAKDLSGTHH